MTHGTLNAGKSNAILMVTAIGGNHHRIDYLNDHRPLGHSSAAGITAPENELQNAEIAKFLETVTQRGRILH